MGCERVGVFPFLTRGPQSFGIILIGVPLLIYGVNTEDSSMLCYGFLLAYTVHFYAPFLRLSLGECWTSTVPSIVDYSLFIFPGLFLYGVSVCMMGVGVLQYCIQARDRWRTYLANHRGEILAMVLFLGLFLTTFKKGCCLRWDKMCTHPLEAYTPPEDVKTRLLKLVETAYTIAKQTFATKPIIYKLYLLVNSKKLILSKYQFIG